MKGTAGRHFRVWGRPRFSLAAAILLFGIFPALEAIGQPRLNPDRNARFSEQHPEFGGMWFDSIGNLHVHTTRTADSADMRRALMEELRARGYSGPEVDGFAKRFVFHEARFTYTQLGAWRHQIARASIERVPGYQSSGVRASSNKIHFGVTDPRGISLLEKIADSLSVPRDAFLVEVEGQICTLEGRTGILVSPRDSVTGELLIAGTRAFARESRFVDSVHVPDGWTGRLEFLPLTLERAGDYEVGVDRDGYEPWRASGIRVERDVCHVIPVRLTARLTRRR